MNLKGLFEDAAERLMAGREKVSAKIGGAKKRIKDVLKEIKETYPWGKAALATGAIAGLGYSFADEHGDNVRAIAEKIDAMDISDEEKQRRFLRALKKLSESE